jgi:hypothetical protein
MPSIYAHLQLECFWTWPLDNAIFFFGTNKKKKREADNDVISYLGCVWCTSPPKKENTLQTTEISVLRNPHGRTS